MGPDGARAFALLILLDCDLLFGHRNPVREPRHIFAMSNAFSLFFTF